MINQLVTRSARRVAAVRACFSQVTESGSRAGRVTPRKKRLVDFGELPVGQIPDALQYSKPSTFNKLSNGVSVATETYPGHQAAVTIAIKVGSRNETVANSTVNQFVSRLALRGSKSKSKTDFERALGNLGDQVQIKTTREITYFTVYVDKAHVADAVALLADGILNPAFESEQIEALRPEIYKAGTTLDPETNAIEGSHYNSFRDHSLGQPSTGIRDNTYSVTSEQIQQFHAKYYVGENITVAGAGDINPNQFNELVQQHFGNVTAKVGGLIDNSDQPFFTPSLMFQRDDEITNITTGAFFVAPSVRDPDFFAMSYFKRLIGSYRIDKHTGSNLNAAHLQYNSFHTDLGNYPDIILQKPFYFAYSDVGIFGNFMFGNEVWGNQLLLLSQNKMSTFASYVCQTELFRARNSYWVELLERNCPIEASQRIATQATYLGRTVSRTEVATRVSNMDASYLQSVASKWFWDKDTSIYAWGPLHHVMSHSIYKRSYRRATLGDYSMVRVKTYY